MRTSVADFQLKNRIMIAHDQHRHAVEDFGADSQAAKNARANLLEAIGAGFAVGLTVADVHRITGLHELTAANQAVTQAIEAAPLEGPVLEPIKHVDHDPDEAGICRVCGESLTIITPKPKRTRRPRTKAIEAEATE